MVRRRSFRVWRTGGRRGSRTSCPRLRQVCGASKNAVSAAQNETPCGKVRQATKDAWAWGERAEAWSTTARNASAAGRSRMYPLGRARLALYPAISTRPLPPAPPSAPPQPRRSSLCCRPLRRLRPLPRRRRWPWKPHRQQCRCRLRLGPAGSLCPGACRRPIQLCRCPPRWYPVQLMAHRWRQLRS